MAMALALEGAGHGGEVRDLITANRQGDGGHGHQITLVIGVEACKIASHVCTNLDTINMQSA